MLKELGLGEFFDFLDIHFKYFKIKIRKVRYPRRDRQVKIWIRFPVYWGQNQDRFKMTICEAFLPEESEKLAKKLQQRLKA